MKNWSIEEITESRPSKSPLWLLDFCLSALYDDKEHRFEEGINKRLTFEELIGALLNARDYILETTDEDELLDCGYYVIKKGNIVYTRDKNMRPKKRGTYS